MNALLNLMIHHYNFIFSTLLKQPYLAELSEWWIRTNVMGSGAFTFILGIMLILNLLHRPAKYKFRIFWAPRWAQIAIRQIVFFNIAINPVFLFGAIVLSIGFIVFYMLFISNFAPSPDAQGPFTSFMK